mmetsp:Transcript_62220/g.181687  ORF Transcript_62220/g.181687 Transcript_62220/m.181687 type:complete len:157 (+) Transcript_62220:261-731(+)
MSPLQTPSCVSFRMLCFCRRWMSSSCQKIGRADDYRAVEHLVDIVYIDRIHVPPVGRWKVSWFFFALGFGKYTLSMHQSCFPGFRSEDGSAALQCRPVGVVALSSRAASFLSICNGAIPLGSFACWRMHWLLKVRNHATLYSAVTSTLSQVQNFFH